MLDKLTLLHRPRFRVPAGAQTEAEMLLFANVASASAVSGSRWRGGPS